MATKAKTPAKKKKAAKVDPLCAVDGGDGCPGVTGELNPYRYQKGCRGEACKYANREYYVQWRAKKATKAKRAKRAAAKAPAKRLPAKKTALKKKTTGRKK